MIMIITKIAMDCDMPFPSSKNSHFQNEAK